ncbi:sugar ABC transporter permease [Mesorhizobium sp. M1339]|uniref:carbohydrate ABC transporter permease n=1 Tax=Mesorhizobium sp. M1339 TaxID=2957086 RepID=UPI00333CB164
MLYLIVPAIAYIALVIVPIVMTARLSLYKTNGFTTPEWVGFDNYTRMVGDRAVRKALVNTLIWTAVTMTVPVAIGLVYAAVLNSPVLRGRAILRALIFLPSTMSLVTLGIMFSLVYNSSFGALNGALNKIGLGFLIQDWLGDPNLVLYSLVAVFAWQFSGLSMALFNAGIQQIPEELYEAAQLDGANNLQRFFYVTLPGVRQVLIVVIALTGILSLRSFDLVYVLTKGGPDNASALLGFLMYVQTFVNRNQGYGAAIAVFILFLSLAFAIVYVRRVATHKALDQ